MSSQRSAGTARSILFINALLLSTALALPAMAQIEEVVVTAQKKSEDIQTVPIAVTAYSAQDLQAHQIVKFSDLQFATPNVSYSQANFGGANFQIRGIGITAVGGGSESGVAVNFADVFLAAPPTDGATFYDLQDLEVLRGPQSTLYGRGATGGTVNIMPNRPDLDTMSVQVDGDYGNYNGREIKGAVNLPIIDGELAVRVAGDYLAHDGWTENIADGSHQNDRDQYSVRGSARWEPTDRTTVDFTAQFSNENDNRARADKELCAPDPTGILGCTPGPLTNGAVNLNATYLNILAGQQGYEGLLSAGLGLQALGNPLNITPPANAFQTPSLAYIETGNSAAENAILGFEGAATLAGANVPQLLASLTGPYAAAIQGYYGAGYAQGLGLGSFVGLVNTNPIGGFVAPANSNPASMRQVNDDFDPINRQQDNFMSLEVKQNVTSWLDATFVGGYDEASYFNEQSYTNTAGPSLGAANVETAEEVFLQDVVGNPVFGGNAALAQRYANLFPGGIGCAASSTPGNPSVCTPTTASFGELPVSNFTGLGISSGSVNRISGNLSSNDQADGAGDQYSGELRFASNFQGPVNFLLGVYYLHAQSHTDYYVASNSLDYAGMLAGGLGTLIDGAEYPTTIGVLCANGCLDGPTYYHNDGDSQTLTSKAIFGEVYYDIVPDLLKFTLGARFTEDQKSQLERIAVLSGLVPIGASNETATLSQEAQECIIQDSSYLPPVCGFDPNTPATSTTGQPFIAQSTEFRKWTGRAVLDWTPNLDFTDKSLFYLSYARGYKAGGFNPGVQGGIAGLPLTYAPESIDAYELGTKNIALGGHLQVNGDLWYYNYSGLQVSAIIDNTSINENINAKLWGAEGEFVYLPTDALQFDLNVAATHSGVANTSEVDERNPTGGDPRAILIKDNSLTSSANQNCVIYDLNSGPVTLPTGYTLVPSAVGPQVASYTAPAVGGLNGLASSGIPNAAFGSCSTSPQLKAFLAAQGFAESDPHVPGSTFTGVPENLNGNELQQTPQMTVSFGAQYTFDVGGEYTLVPRIDYYWQTHMWGRIFDDPSDLIKGWGEANAMITLNAPDNRWYVGAYIKNLFDKTYITGEYLTSSSSGLYTNAFLGDPRTYGIQAGVHF